MKQRKMNKTLIIIRGVQGSGKSTLANSICRAHDMMAEEGEPFSDHFEADMFFNGPEGYKWDGSKIGEAHRWCQHQVYLCMQKERPLIIVSNTFVKKEEMKPYLEMAQQHGYETQEIICRGRFQNVHGVPADKVEAKLRQFEF